METQATGICPRYGAVPMTFGSSGLGSVSRPTCSGTGATQEWMGTQGGGWGHNEGITVFEGVSQHGNGVVSVTAHPAATLRRDSGISTVAEASASPEEWRVLRFNGTTRQSVARVTLSADGHIAAQPDCLAFEYMKSLAASGAGRLISPGIWLRC